ncbi:unnamed protein product [Cuscuta epithymum]|uniref:Reverse transcriptase Ty1/copia-type domain-containing protein n=1 Tax=Cuscuta epithymum TaxID=186058 RepID=A0AAV0G393_9ASTE|nr:unnamed protein product [Cuscuta epithymum]
MSKMLLLHGYLTEEVYMRQPQDFVHPSFAHHICRLRKALYGLKQAPRAWFHGFSGFLLSHGFTQRNSSSTVSSFISTLSHTFAMKDLGEIHYFLGIQTLHTSKGMFLSQQKYISDLLRHFHLHTVKLVCAPLPSRTTLSLTDGELLADGTEYCSMIFTGYYF